MVSYWRAKLIRLLGGRTEEEFQIEKNWRMGLLDDKLQLQQSIDKMTDLVNKYIKSADKDQMTIQTLLKERQDLEEKNIHSSLERFYKYLKTIPSSPKYYNFGKGRRQVHTIFAQALGDKAIVKKFLQDSKIIDMVDFKDPDKIVSSFSNAFSRTFPTTKYYAADLELYGMIEFWALPRETIDKLNKGKKAFDCDDVMVLKFACLHYLLNLKFPEAIWRLRGFVVDLWTGGGHAILGWVSSKHNDWIAIETTFYDTKQLTISKFKLRDQLFYDIRYSFDQNTEYKRL